MNSVSRSLSHAIEAYDPHRPAMTRLDDGSQITFGDLDADARRYRRNLANLGLQAGETIAAALAPGRDLFALVLACWASGLRLTLVAPGSVAAFARTQAGSTLVMAEPAGEPVPHLQCVLIGELEQPAATGPQPEPRDHSASASLSVFASGAVETMDADMLVRSIENFAALHPLWPGATLLSVSSPRTLDEAFLSVVLPLARGLHVITAKGAPLTEPARFEAALRTADYCELSASDWLALAERDSPPVISDCVRALLCGDGALTTEQRARLQQRLGRPVTCGFGTRRSGLWAIAIGAAEASAGRFAVALRPLRSALHLAGAEPGSGTGEIILRPTAGGPEQRTGTVGWIATNHRLEPAGSLADVVVRGGRAFLLSDLDRQLADRPGIRASRTFREHGASPTEKVICVCIGDSADMAPPDCRLSDGDATLTPDRTVMLSSDDAGSLPDVQVLRSVVSGEAGRAVLDALTARRFRRNPAYDEAGLAAAVDRALLRSEPLDFLMFWGCGPRPHAGPPDRAAMAALGDLLAAAEAAAPLRARAHIVCTDGHATNNGHSALHYTTYFGEIGALAAALDASLELESAVWRRGGLTAADISALEQEPDFAERWDRFPLRSRFIHQAERHSGMADKVEAARHYYATCLLEREVLKRLFAGSVFLTYNGPDFNECFPDLPTLYVYPGPRGRNDKPWFVDVGEPGGADETVQVVAA